MPQLKHSCALVAAGVALLSLLTACDEQPPGRFDQLDRARILALRASPLTLPQGQGSLHALLYPAPDAQTSYEWSWCPYRVLPRDDYACPVTRAEHIALMASAARMFLQEDEVIEDAFWQSLPAYELGAAASPDFIHTMDPEAAEIMCGLTFLAALNERPDLQDHFQSVDCAQGFEVDVTARITHQDKALVSKKSVLLQTQAKQPLTNPSLRELEARRIESADASPLEWLPLGQQELVLGEVYELRASVDPEAVDLLTPTPRQEDDPAGREEDEVLRDERFDFAWFSSAPVLARVATQGTFAQKDDEPQPDPQEDPASPLESSNILDLRDPPCQSSPCDIELIVVVRDEQLGVDWRRITLSPVEAP